MNISTITESILTIVIPIKADEIVTLGQNKFRLDPTS